MAAKINSSHHGTWEELALRSWWYSRNNLQRKQNFIGHLKLCSFHWKILNSAVCPKKGSQILFFFLLLSKNWFKIVFCSVLISIHALGCHWTNQETFSSPELLLDGGCMLPRRHLITNLISGTCIFSFYFVLLRTALPLYVTYTVCRYHCNYLGSAVAQQFSQNQNTVHDYFSQLPYTSHQSFLLLLQEGYVIKDWNLSLPKTVVSSFGSTIQCQLQAQK